jgi:hypothetical protein
MGGMISVVFRFPDGDVKTFSTWTNPLRFHLMRPAIFKGDAEVLEYDRLVAALGNAPSSVAPSEYGLMVYDYVSNTIFAMNTYGHHNFVSPGILCNDGTGGTRRQYEELMAESRLGKGLFRYRECTVEALGPLDWGIRDFDGLAGMAKDIFRKSVNVQGPTMEVFTVDTSPMTYRRFEEYEFDEMKTAMEKAGFSFTKEDQARWTGHSDWLALPDGR